MLPSPEHIATIFTYLYLYFSSLFGAGCMVYGFSCSRSNPNAHPEQAELHPVAVSDRVFHRWGIDLVGPLKKTSRDNIYVITATEYLTK